MQFLDVTKFNENTQHKGKLLLLKHFLREVTWQINIYIPFPDGDTKVDIHKVKYIPEIGIYKCFYNILSGRT
jgi:hypothetical protein